MLIEQASAVKASDKYTPMIEKVGNLQRQQMSEAYDERRKAAQDRMTERYDKIDRQVDAQIDQEVNEKGLTSDEDVQDVIDKYEETRNALYEKAGREYDEEIADIDKEQAEKEEELTRAIEELTKEVRDSGGQINPNSYLNNLQEERNKAIVERDTAVDEDSARAAAARVRDLDAQIRDVQSGRKPGESSRNGERENTDYGTRALQTMMGFNMLSSGLANRNIGSIIMGGTQMVTGMMGMGDRGAARALGWARGFAMIGSLLTQAAQRSDQMAGLAALVRNDDSLGHGTIAETRDQLDVGLSNYNPTGVEGAGTANMGLSTPQFAQQAQERIRQRGLVNRGISEAYYQEALERVFSLNQGALGQAGRYDRYGTNVTDALSNLISRLERISNSGISQGNYVRAQEYLDMQQSIMQQYMRFQNNPNIGIANREIEAFAQLGTKEHPYTVDSRTAGEIGAVRNMVVNPQNDRMRAILYSTVEQLHPETAGRSDLIDRYINDPKYQGEIIRAYMQRIQSMWGGTNTQMGYWAARNALQTVPVGRLDAIWNGLATGQAGKTFAEGRIENSEGDTTQKQEYAGEVKDYATGTTQTLIKLSDKLYETTETVAQFFASFTEFASGQKSFFDWIRGRVGTFTQW